MIQPISHYLLEDIKHGLFTRQGGVSQGIYKGLNVGLGSNDDIQHILQNRKLVAEFFGSDDIYSCFQIHSNKVTVIDSQDKLWDSKNCPESDAIVCNQKGIPISALSADCGTVLFADTNNQVIGCAHAGWRGAKDNIIKNVIDEMIKLGAQKQNIVAVIGPVISQDSYEVGQEFYDNFINANKDYDKYFIKKEKHHFDLNQFIINKLQETEISAIGSLYETHKTDTYNDIDNFYSFRRSVHNKEEDYGRQASVICL